MNKKMMAAIGVVIGAILITAGLCYYNSVNRYIKRYHRNQAKYDRLERRQDKLHEDNEYIRGILSEKGLVFPEAGQQI